MKIIINGFSNFWFQSRIFISLSIVISISAFSFLLAEGPATIEIIGKLFGLPSGAAIQYGYLLTALIVLSASAMRMWAGTILTSQTVMKFKVQNNTFITTGPYSFVRNPIYFADLIAFSSLSLCLTPVGLLIPLLIFFHYHQLIKYEEKKLRLKHGFVFEDYVQMVPGLFPGIKQVRFLPDLIRDFKLNFDGFRHNAQYLLFIPGLIIASFTGKFIHAIIIALPAVVDWVVIHTIIGISKGNNTKNDETGKKEISRLKVFNDILYGQCWEDPEMDRIAFGTKRGETIFSISSGGCNALAFLLDNPAEVICLDLNPFQNYLLSLKMNAFKKLEYNEVLEFFGVHPSTRRLEYFEKIKPALPEAERKYWTNKKADLSIGIIHCGKYERYMHLLKRVFNLLIGKKVINELFNSPGLEDQQILFKSKWDNFRWRLFCRIFLSRILATMFFDKEFYRYLEPSFSFDKYYRSAVRKVITQLPARQNYFLAYILTGNYLPDNLPVYLRKENFEIIRDRTDRIRIITSGCRQYLATLPDNSISKFNFTNIFEWMSVGEFTLLLREVVRIATDGAVITYRNHLVTRNRPEILARNIIPDVKLSAELLRTDRSFIYKGYVVERVKKNICHS